MKKRFVFLSFIGLILSSCAFNFMYYFPDKNEVKESEKGQDIYINFEEDKNLHAILYERKDPIASIFIVHGNGGNLAGWSGIAEYLWEQGYQTFIFDFPSFGNSDGKAKHKIVIPASQKAFDHFLTLKGVQESKKIMLGYSLGANLTLKLGPDNQDNLDAIVVEGLFNNYKDIGIDHTPKVLRFAPWLLLGTKFKGEETIQTWTKPILLIHSTDDQTCPYWMAEEVYEKIKSKDKELWTIDGPHIRGMSLYEDLYMDKLKKIVE